MEREQKEREREKEGETRKRSGKGGRLFRACTTRISATSSLFTAMWKIQPRVSVSLRLCNAFDTIASSQSMRVNDSQCARARAVA